MIRRPPISPLFPYPPLFRSDLYLHDIRRRLAADVPAVLTDLLEIAAYVFAADEMVSRGGPAMAVLGRGWRRRFRFVLPVRHPPPRAPPAFLLAFTDSPAFLVQDGIAFQLV